MVLILRNILLLLAVGVFTYSTPMVQDLTEALYLLQGKTEGGFIDPLLAQAVSDGLMLIREQFPQTKDIHDYAGYDLNHLVVTFCPDAEVEDCEHTKIPKEILRLNTIFHAKIQNHSVDNFTCFVDLLLRFDGVCDILTIKKRYESLHDAGVIIVLSCTKSDTNNGQFSANRIDLYFEGEYLQFAFYQSTRLVLECFYNRRTSKLEGVKIAPEENPHTETESLLAPEENSCCLCNLF
jgi:hypothetical protein